MEDMTKRCSKCQGFDTKKSFHSAHVGKALDCECPGMRERAYKVGLLWVEHWALICEKCGYVSVTPVKDGDGQPQENQGGSATGRDVDRDHLSQVSPKHPSTGR